MLFDKSPLPVNQYGYPIARKTDPETSKVNLVDLPENQKLFMKSLVGEMTAAEVAARAVVHDGDSGRVYAKRETVRKRAGELVRIGLIEVCGSRHCLVTGKLAQVYRRKM